MASGGVDRLLRVNAILKKEIAQFLESGAILLPEGVLVSITEVKCSVDLRNAIVFASVFGGGDGAGATVVRKLNNAHAAIQAQIGRYLKFKYTPKLRFELDDRMAGADRVMRLFEEEEEKRDVDE